MTPTVTTEREVREWMRALRRALAPLAPKDRRGIVTQFTSHVEEATTHGTTPREALAELGDPAVVAQQALDDYRDATRRDPRGYFVNVRRVLQFIAAALALGGVIAASLLPSFVTVSQDSSGRQMIETPSLLSAMGTGYLALLAVPLLIACLPLPFRSRAWQVTSILSTVVLAVCVGVGIVTLGNYFIPALIVSVASLFFPWYAPSTK